MFFFSFFHFFIFSFFLFFLLLLFSFFDFLMFSIDFFIFHLFAKFCSFFFWFFHALDFFTERGPVGFARLLNLLNLRCWLNGLRSQKTKLFLNLSNGFPFCVGQFCVSL